MSDKIDRLAKVRDRIAEAMGWQTGAASPGLSILRQVADADAIALGVAKAEELADALQELYAIDDLKAENADACGALVVAESEVTRLRAAIREWSESDYDQPMHVEAMRKLYEIAKEEA